MTEYRTEQEAFWAGKFGDEYIKRNQGAQLLATNLSFFALALRSAQDVACITEFGAKIGMKLRALRQLYPAATLRGIEINATAADELAGVIGAENVVRGSIPEVEPPVCDLALIKGVLIHLNPEILAEVYDKLVSATRRWLLVAEYCNPSPVTISYRDNTDKLFKRDFAGEIMQRYPQIKLVDYGFVYRGDPQFPADDVTWFLMEKR